MIVDIPQLGRVLSAVLMLFSGSSTSWSIVDPSCLRKWCGDTQLNNKIQQERPDRDSRSLSLLNAMGGDIRCLARLHPHRNDDKRHVV